ncbi:hypothetical protein SBOR_4927 [Sclerotinia borealis F-4128]|uniref:Uncharacterized protein n=1 Tax=Sclerotinia borealis (strain F-4128) TaxID=1432307 RepID=W9CFM9_SCLBF|nr:hypothetical protein SBOR_4927 [Sclerotinia borealis F-4128]
MNTSETSIDLWPSTPDAVVVSELDPSSQELPESTDIMFNSDNHSVHDIALNDDHRYDSVDRPIARTFMQEVEKLVTEKLGRASAPASSIFGRSRDNPSLQASIHGSRQKDIDYALPTREHADSLLSSYWRYVHVLLSKTTIRFGTVATQ